MIRVLWREAGLEICFHLVGVPVVVALTEDTRCAVEKPLLKE